jgi:MFS family permease
VSKKERRPLTRYPHSIRKVYWNVIIAILSIALTVMLLKQPLLLIYYIIFTFILAMVAFQLKARFSTIFTPIAKDIPPENEEKPRRRLLVLLFLLIMAILSLPFLLAGVFHEMPHVWFILIMGIATGLSISEVLFYIYCEKM